MSAHNESVDGDALLRAIASHASVIEAKRENSRLRWLMARWLAEPMRTRPWLTRVVIGVDDAFNATVAKLVPSLGPSSLIVLAQNSGTFGHMKV